MTDNFNTVEDRANSVGLLLADKLVKHLTWRFCLTDSQTGAELFFSTTLQGISSFLND